MSKRKHCSVIAINNQYIQAIDQQSLYVIHDTHNNNNFTSFPYSICAYLPYHEDELKDVSGLRRINSRGMALPLESLEVLHFLVLPRVLPSFSFAMHAAT